MAQRHHYFIIARVHGRHRILASIYQSGCIGIDVINRCRDTVRILQFAGNRIPIEDELKAAARYDEDFWSQSNFNGTYALTGADVPFPFLLTCLILGNTYGIRDGYISNSAIVVTTSSEYFREKRTEGMTVFDITNVSRVRYCFVRNRTPGTDERLAWMVPLSAHTYIKPYFLNPISSRENLSTLEEIQDCSLISTAALEDTWPNESWKEPGDLNDLQKIVWLAPGKFDVIASIESEGPRSLRDQAMDVLTKTLMSYPESALQVASEAEVLADFNQRLKNRFYDDAESLKPSVTLLKLLYATLKDEVYVDLSPFHTLTYNDLVSLVSQLQDHDQMTQLNLSNMPNLTGEGLALLLSPEPRSKLQVVFLMENPQVSVESLSALGSGYELYHSGLLQHSMVSHQEEGRTGRLPLLDFSAEKNPVTQLLWVGVTRDQSHAPNFRKPDGSMSWATLSPDNETPMLRSRYLAERLSYNVFPLTDVPLTMPTATPVDA